MREVLAPNAGLERGGVARAVLDRRIRALVRLSALLAADACTTSLQWAVEGALATGVDEDAIVAVLLATAPIAGSAWLVATAPRLALALGVETQPSPLGDPQPAGGATDPRARRPRRDRRPLTATRPRACGRRRAPES